MLCEQHREMEIFLLVNGIIGTTTITVYTYWTFAMLKLFFKLQTMVCTVLEAHMAWGYRVLDRSTSVGIVRKGVSENGYLSSRGTSKTLSGGKEFQTKWTTREKPSGRVRTSWVPEPSGSGWGSKAEGAPQAHRQWGGLDFIPCVKGRC